MITSIEEALRRIAYLDELRNKLAYDHFTTKQTLPFACYHFDFDTSGADDYNGEKEVELDGIKYGIYRTYEVDKDYVELYCERKGGVQ